MEENKVNEQPTGEAESQWELRIKGLQTALNRKEDEIRKALTQAESYKAELEASKGTISELENRLKKLEEERAALAEEKSRLQEEAARHARDFVRISKIAAHPELLEHDRQGLLRQDLDPTSEEFDQYLKRYLEVLSGKVARAVQDTLQGAVPQSSPPKESQRISKEDLMDQMRKAVLSGDMDTYESLRRALLTGE